MKSSMSKWIAGLFIALNLSACGGGGGGDSGTPEGVYEGTLSTGEYLNTIILEDNLFYTIYGEIFNDEFLVEGFFTGTGKIDGNRFTAYDVRDFDASGLGGGGSLSATFEPGKRFNGSTSGGTTFTAKPPTDTSYNYNAAARLANIVGTWSVTRLNLSTVTLNIAADGSYTAVYDGGNCDFEGQFTPRASGKNVFDVNVNSGGAGGATCDVVVPGTAAHAVEFLLSNGQRQLIIAGTDEERENGTLLIGAR